MPLINPVTAANFHVFMANEESPILGAISAAAAFTTDMLTGTFASVEGLDAQLKVEDYEEGGLNTDVRRFATRAAYGTLTFKRGVTPNPDLWDWQYAVLHGSGNVIRKSGLIVLTDSSGATGGDTPLPIALPVLDRTPVAAWTFRGALPSKLTGPKFNASASEIAIETLEISHQGLERLGLAMVPGVGDTLAAIGL